MQYFNFFIMIFFIFQAYFGQATTSLNNDKILERIISKIQPNKSWYLIMAPSFDFIAHNGGKNEEAIKKAGYPKAVKKGAGATDHKKENKKPGNFKADRNSRKMKFSNEPNKIQVKVTKKPIKMKATTKTTNAPCTVNFTCKLVIEGNRWVWVPE